MAVQTRNVTVTISDNDGSPLENARVVIALVGLGNEPGGAVAPGPQEKFTAANGQVVFELWENNDIYSSTHYEVQSWHPVRGTPIHRRNKFYVPGYDADLEELIALEMADPDPGQRLGNMALIDGSNVGQNLAQIPNPNAVRFIRINTDNTVSVLNAADFRAAIGAGTGGGGIASIALEVPTGLSVTGSPLTSSGTLTITFAAGYSIPTDSKQANWDQAYADRNKWDGGSTGLNPATGRASLGATTVGSSFFTTANPNAISYARVNANNTVTFVSAATLATELGVTSKLDASAVGVSVASLVGGLVPSNQLPSYVDDVLEFANLAGFPATGESGKIYIALDTNRQYRWSGSSYVQIVSSPGTTDNVPEGSTNLYHTQARVRATTLTGFAAAVGLNAVLATDTILAAFQKIQGWLNGLGNLSTINASANVVTMLGSADNAAIRTNIGAAKSISLVTVSTASHNVDSANESGYHRFTFNGAKSVTVRPDSIHSLPSGGSWVFRNSNTGNLTIVADSGVTINVPYSGTLLLEPGMTATLQKIGTDLYDLIGQTVTL